MTSIVIADDHQLLREGLSAVLDSQPDLKVVGQAADGRAAIEAVARLRPDVLIVDLVMPGGLSGIDVVREVKERFPRVRMIVVSMHSTEEYVLAALRGGALGYVLKDAGADVLIQAIHTVLAGRRYLCSPLSERAIEVYLGGADVAPLDPSDMLSTREREILGLVAEGKTNAEIGEKLFLSARTVETHRAALMHKMGFKNPIDLVRYALRHGLLSAEE
jgi:DNA-binding NarL/FixJ family response regulator